MDIKVRIDRIVGYEDSKVKAIASAYRRRICHSRDQNHRFRKGAVYPNAPDIL